MKMKGLLIAGILGLSACTSLQQQYHYETLNTQTDHIKFKFVIASNRDGREILSGNLFHIFSKVGFDKGHVDISVYDASETFLFDAVGTYRSPLNAYREWVQTGVKFKAELPSAIPKNATVKLAFHMDQSPEKTVEHGKNISR